MQDRMINFSEDGSTLADFTVSASAAVMPDTLTAVLTLTVTGESVAMAQHKLNTKMTPLVRGLKMIGNGYFTVSTGGYYAGENHNQDPNSDNTTDFVARQSVILKGSNFSLMLAAIADLQGKNLELVQMNYSMSAEQQGGMNNDLLTKAIKKADDTAKVLASSTGYSQALLLRMTPMMPGDGNGAGGMESMAASMGSSRSMMRAEPVSEASEMMVTVRLTVLYRLTN